MKTNRIVFVTALLSAVIISSCKKEDPAPQTNTTSTGSTSVNYTGGIFVSNEGPFLSGSGTVCFIDRTNKTVSYDIFNKANNRVLGNVVQSVEIYNGKGYVVVNNANKIEVVTASAFASTGVVNNLVLPRFFAGISSTKGYVSQWGTNGLAGSVAVIDLGTNTVSKTINTGKGAEHMVINGGNAYVTCSGGFGNDSVVSVINTTTDAITTSILTGHNPNSIVTDMNGKLWVLCGGINDYTTPANSTAGKLVCIDPSINNVLLTVTFPSNTAHPSNLVINKAKDRLYYNYNGQMYDFKITATSLNSSALINRSFYGLGVDPVNDNILATDAGNFSSDGWLLRYNTTGAKIDSFKVGIIPGNFGFN